MGCAMGLGADCVSKSCLGLMAKYWQPGEVKTRLAADLGPQQAAAIYRQFVATLVARLGQAAEQTILAFAPPERLAEFEQFVPANWELEPQSGGDLGSRMHHFFLPRRQATVLLGSDSPNLPLALLDEAFAQLAHHDIVLGPTEDGGYYLVGAARITPSIFSNIPWSTDQVWQRTIEAVQRAGYSYKALPTWYDVDQLSDLERLIADLQNDPTRDAPLQELLHALVNTK